MKDIQSVNKKGVNYASFVLKASANNSVIVGIEACNTKTKGLNMYFIRKAYTHELQFFGNESNNPYLGQNKYTKNLGLLRS